MRYKLLGASGLRVSELALGTMTFGEVWGWGSSKDDSRAVFDTFLDAGGNFVDTSNFYTEGASETYLGAFMHGRREQVVLASKYTDTAPTKDPNAGGNQRKNLVQSLDGTLKRFRTDYVDLYSVHSWDFFTPVEEVMRALDDQVRAGKVLYLGISDTPAWIVAQANTLAHCMGWTLFVANQIEYNLVERTSDREQLPMSRALDLGVVSWSPLAAGLLTGKYNDGAASNGTPRRFDVSPQAPMNERTLGITAVVQQGAAALGATPVQVALAWIRHRGVIPLVGARRAEQLRENLGYLDLTLDDAHMQQLDAVSRVELGFPINFLSSDMERNAVYGGTCRTAGSPKHSSRRWRDDRRRHPARAKHCARPAIL